MIDRWLMSTLAHLRSFNMSVMSLAQAGFTMPSVHNYTSQVSTWPTNMANKYYSTTTLSHSHLPVNCLFTPELYHCSHYIRPLSFLSHCKVYTQCFIPVVAKPCLLSLCIWFLTLFWFTVFFFIDWKIMAVIIIIIMTIYQFCPPI